MMTSASTMTTVASHRSAGRAAIASGMIGIIAYGFLWAFLITMISGGNEQASRPLINAHDVGVLLQSLFMIPLVVGVGLLIASVFPVGNFHFVDPTLGPLPFSYEPPAGTERANDILHNILAIGGFLGVAPLPVWDRARGPQAAHDRSVVTVGVTTE